MSFFYCIKNIPRGYIPHYHNRPSTEQAKGEHSQKQRGWGAMPNRSSRWGTIRKMAYERDRKLNAPCWWCGQAINYIVKPSSEPDAYEGDHKIPVSKRPDLELDLNNVMPSHRRCNRSRGDGTNGENSLGMQSRIW